MKRDDGISVSVAELEAAQEIADKFGAALNAEGRADLNEVVAAALRVAILAERAACATIADGWGWDEIAAAIRARPAP